MAHPVVHWEICTSDPAASAEFYQKLFGWNIHHAPEMHYWLTESGGEGGIGGGIMARQAPEQQSVSFYVLVDDLQQSLDEAAALGATVVLPPTPIPGHGGCAMFVDPQGVAIGLYTSQQIGG